MNIETTAVSADVSVQDSSVKLLLQTEYTFSQAHVQLLLLVLILVVVSNNIINVGSRNSSVIE